MREVSGVPCCPGEVQGEGGAGGGRQHPAFVHLEPETQDLSKACR